MDELERTLREFIPHLASYCIPSLHQAILSAGYVKLSEVELRRFVEENDLIRKFRYSRLEFYVDKNDTWDRRKYENDPLFRAEIDTKVAYEISMFNPIIDFLAHAITQAERIVKVKE